MTAFDVIAIMALSVLFLALAVSVACEVANLRDSRRTQLRHGPHDPIYFPCPTCGRPVDGLNKSMMDDHAKFHADEFIRGAEAGK